MSSSSLESLLDKGYIPHSIIRLGIRRQLASRLSSIASSSLTASYESKMRYVGALRGRPIAIETKTANQQHYEVGTGVLKEMLGPRMKYSCAWYEDGVKTLEEAEVRMLEMYVERAELRDGMRILDLGCGWGSLTLYLAQKFPSSHITAFSNSHSQARHITHLASTLSLPNITTQTGDIVTHSFPPGTYDRILSIELFEHMKNYELLLSKCSAALKPSGKLFVHLFCHRDTPYDFTDGDGWMSTHFFTGGTMPSADLMLWFQRDLRVRRQWWVCGRNYARTCEDWLTKMLTRKAEIWPHLEETYGKEDAGIWWNRWQIFYMACAELFAYEGGDTWGVAHYLFEKPE